MDWHLFKIVVALVAIVLVTAMIITMIVGSVRSTAGRRRRRVEWSHTTDRDFLPWEEDDH